ncbi:MULTISPECIES: DUF4389 domain-containing protein [unclassified Pseudonocardia]|uniref:DUF4389 domain-containing protein n=1 Tax=unclassified Pseudonocardia TaxID=2619320 RepID=UPI000A4362B8
MTNSTDPATSDPGSPVRLQARLDPVLSRWLWLVKWLLLVPHIVVLAVLGAAVWVLTIAAFLAILVTGRYPRVLFGFNLGVIRWWWRVAWYGYGGLGTDRYPRFALDDSPDDPARLDVAYPGSLSRGLVLVKWWLLALPHYAVLAFLVGAGGTGLARAGGGLLSLLVLFVAVLLLFTGGYPAGLFGLVTGIDRWVLRVVAYAGLMTDAYPPMRMDQGGTDPAGPLPGPGTSARAAAPAATEAAAGSTALRTRPGTTTVTPAAVVQPPPTGRSVLLGIGAWLVLLGAGLGIGGGTGATGLAAVVAAVVAGSVVLLVGVALIVVGARPLPDGDQR